jgi:hypothetical protein
MPAMTDHNLEARDWVKFSGLTSVALNRTGSLAAAAVNDREIVIYQVAKGKLLEQKTISLIAGKSSARANQALNLTEIKIAFQNDEILLIAGNFERGRHRRLKDNNHVGLTALAVQTGKVLGRFADESYDVVANPLVIAPHHALLFTLSTVICIDLTTFRESFRIRTFDPDGQVIGEEGVSGGEQVTPNGVAYDPRTRRLYVLWREFVSSYLQTYRLRLEKDSFERLDRRLIESSPDLALEGAGLCLDSTGRQVAVWLTTMDEVVDCRTQNGLKMPDKARLGQLALVDRQGARFIDVESALEFHPWLHGDFSIASYTDSEGKEIGIRYGVGHYEAKPFFLDQQTIVVNTPSGILLGVNQQTGAVQKLNRIGQSVADLWFHGGKRRLIQASRQGMLHFYSV